MIKNKLLLLAVIAASLLLPAAVRADIEIQVGDRPYYSHGARYWAGDYEMVWVPGHMGGHHWIHGHYIRGESRHHGWIGRHLHGQDYHHDDYRQ